MEKYIILYKDQYELRSKQSAIHPIVHLLKGIADANENITKYITLVVLLDLSKAFDTTDYEIYTLYFKLLNKSYFFTYLLDGSMIELLGRRTVD